ncbi:MAG: pseudouridine synthase [Planctomycetota bacterium]
MPSRPGKTSRPGKKSGPAKSGRPGKKKAASPRDRSAEGPPKRRRPKARPKPAAEPRNDGLERLQKVLAAAGLASRRECETLIEEGRVEVDGQVVTELGVRVDPFEQTIHVDGEQLRQPKRVYFAVNKPEGVVCTARDPAGRPRVTDLLPPDFGRVFAVGRLDLASEGLILVTNDGELANQLTHPRHGVQKTYHVQVAGHPTAETLRELRGGIRLAEGKAHFLEARIKSRRKNSTILEVVLDEGRNREIRRLLARVEHKVQRLTRVAVGPVRLGDMPAGAYRALTREELKKLRESVDAPPAEQINKAAKPQRKRPTAKASSAKRSGPAKRSGTAKRKRKP